MISLIFCTLQIKNLTPSHKQNTKIVSAFLTVIRSITRSYYRNSVGAVLVYDITNRQSFEHLDEWLDELRLHLLPRQVVYAVVGHKADMAAEQRAVTQAEGRRFAAHHGGLHFLETSAKTGENVEEVFSVIARDIYSMLERGMVQIEEGWDGIKTGFCNGDTCLRLRMPGGSRCCRSRPDSCC